MDDVDLSDIEEDDDECGVSYEHTLQLISSVAGTGIGEEENWRPTWDASWECMECGAEVIEDGLTYNPEDAK